jgi:ubiquinone/menaquinone biosynthesis C-methylase UbiE
MILPYPPLPVTIVRTPTTEMSRLHERMFPHDHAQNLDSAERRTWLPPAEVLDKLDLAAGMRVADIGAGTGYFAIPIAGRVASHGRVHAVDLQPEMLALLQERMPADAPIDLVRGSAEATGLPDASQDLVLFANVWHEIDDRDAALAEATRVIRPGGRIAILDWRPDCAPPPGPPTDHRLPGADVAEHLQRAGWRAPSVCTVAAYSYLVTASRPAHP